MERATLVLSFFGRSARVASLTAASRSPRSCRISGHFRKSSASTYASLPRRLQPDGPHGDGSRARARLRRRLGGPARRLERDLDLGRAGVADLRQLVRHVVEEQAVSALTLVIPVRSLQDAEPADRGDVHAVGAVSAAIEVD